MQTNSIINTFLTHFTDSCFLENIGHIYLYNSDIAQSAKATTGEIDGYITTFLDKLNKNLNNPTLKNIPIKAVKDYIATVKSIISIRKNISSTLINYDNIFQHFSSADLTVSNFLKKIVNNPIENNSKFRLNVDNILQTIKVYHEISEINPTLKKIDDLNYGSVSGLPVFDTLKNYKETVIEAYNNLNSIKSLVTEEALSDYFIFSDKESANGIVDETLTYLKEGYSRYKTGYPVIDDNIGGLESNCVTLIAGPSNHAKSLFMLNLAKNVILLNDTFDKQDAILFITLEDQIFKFSRRLMSIFGNYDSYFVKNTFDSVHSFLKRQKNTDITRPEDDRQARKILHEMFTTTIENTTNNKVQFIFKHADENTLSCSDIAKFIDMLAMNGVNVKCLFIDYLDTLIPNNMMYSAYEDYNSQGVITQDMRNLSKQYSIPIISITQNSKMSLDMRQEMSNEVIGDSYKKVRYADYILMVRLRKDLDMLNEEVKKDIQFDDHKGNGFNKSTSNIYSESLSPFEVKITKAKDGKKDAKSFHIVNWMNLRFYSSHDEYVKDQSNIKDTLDSISDLGLLSSDIDATMLESDSSIII